MKRSPSMRKMAQELAEFGSAFADDHQSHRRPAVQKAVSIFSYFVDVCYVIRRDVLLGRNIVDELFHLSARELGLIPCRFLELPQGILEFREHPDDIGAFKAFLAYSKIGKADTGSV